MEARYTLVYIVRCRNVRNPGYYSNNSPLNLFPATLNSMLYMLNARQNLRAKTQKENYVRAHVCLEVDLKALEGDVKVVASNGRQSRAGATV